MEPVAAAYSYESTLDHDELILIGDFGGGTSDFSLLRVGPGVRRRGRTKDDLVGNSGVGLAGDAFDARIVRKLISPALGSNSEARSLEQAAACGARPGYTRIWSDGTIFRFCAQTTCARSLKSARVRALEPEKIRALIAIVDGDLGYQLHQAVQQVKFELSRSEEAEFRFHDAGMNLRIPVKRANSSRGSRRNCKHRADVWIR